MFDSGYVGSHVARWYAQAQAVDPRAFVRLITSTQWTGEGFAVGLALKGGKPPAANIPTIVVERYGELSEMNARAIYAVARHELSGQRLPLVVSVLNYTDEAGRSRTAIFL